MTLLMTGLIGLVISRQDTQPDFSLVEFVADSAFLATIMALVWINLKHHIYPNIITYPGLILALVARSLVAAVGRNARFGNTLESSFLFSTPVADFAPWSAAVFGALILAISTPALWLMDRFDLVLFRKYFDWEEYDEKTQTDDLCAEVNEAELWLRRREKIFIGATMALSVALAIGWAAVILYARQHPRVYSLAYDGLLYAVIGALLCGVLFWLLRALYFWVRGFEGMGLGDIKLMMLVGAYLGPSLAISSILAGSVLGTIYGIYRLRSRSAGFETGFPTGLMWGIPALVLALRGWAISLIEGVRQWWDWLSGHIY